ncbi:hypothetical protein BC833DRAFT_340099 [Globomyces pollinis-pini]|nr:hypothetical protein BC833DRAFT_340099 [Globomyces pollinis-pini]
MKLISSSKSSNISFLEILDSFTRYFLKDLKQQMKNGTNLNSRIYDCYFCLSNLLCCTVHQTTHAKLFLFNSPETFCKHWVNDILQFGFWHIDKSVTPIFELFSNCSKVIATYLLSLAPQTTTQFENECQFLALVGKFFFIMEVFFKESIENCPMYIRSCVLSPTVTSYLLEMVNNYTNPNRIPILHVLVFPFLAHCAALERNWDECEKLVQGLLMFTVSDYQSKSVNRQHVVNWKKCISDWILTIACKRLCLVNSKLNEVPLKRALDSAHPNTRFLRQFCCRSLLTCFPDDLENNSVILLSLMDDDCVEIRHFVCDVLALFSIAKSTNHMTIHSDIKTCKFYGDQSATIVLQKSAFRHFTTLVGQFLFNSLKKSEREKTSFGYLAKSITKHIFSRCELYKETPYPLQWVSKLSLQLLHWISHVNEEQLNVIVYIVDGVLVGSHDAEGVIPFCNLSVLKSFLIVLQRLLVVKFSSIRVQTLGIIETLVGQNMKAIPTRETHYTHLKELYAIIIETEKQVLRGSLTVDISSMEKIKSILSHGKKYHSICFFKGIFSSNLSNNSVESEEREMPIASEDVGSDRLQYLLSRYASQQNNTYKKSHSATSMKKDAVLEVKKCDTPIGQSSPVPCQDLEIEKELTIIKERSRSSQPVVTPSANTHHTKTVDVSNIKTVDDSRIPLSSIPSNIDGGKSMNLFKEDKVSAQPLAALPNTAVSEKSFNVCNDGNDVLSSKIIDEPDENHSSFKATQHTWLSGNIDTYDYGADSHASFHSPKENDVNEFKSESSYSLSSFSPFDEEKVENNGDEFSVDGTLKPNTGNVELNLKGRADFENDLFMDNIFKSASTDRLVVKDSFAQLHHSNTLSDKDPIISENINDSINPITNHHSFNCDEQMKVVGEKEKTVDDQSIGNLYSVGDTSIWKPAHDCETILNYIKGDIINNDSKMEAVLEKGDQVMIESHNDRFIENITAKNAVDLVEENSKEHILTPSENFFEKGIINMDNNSLKNPTKEDIEIQSLVDLLSNPDNSDLLKKDKLAEEVTITPNFDSSSILQQHFNRKTDGTMNIDELVDVPKLEIDLDAFILKQGYIDVVEPNIQKSSRFMMTREDSFSSLKQENFPSKMAHARSAPLFGLKDETSESHEEGQNTARLQTDTIGTSFFIQATPQVILPVMKKSIIKAIELAVKHLKFDKNRSQIVDYGKLYSNGLLDGKLKQASMVITEGHDFLVKEVLHPSLKEIFLLDHTLFIDMLSDLQFVSPYVMTDRYLDMDLINWIKGLVAVHRHLLVLSKCLFNFESKMGIPINTAQCMILLNDQ